MVLVLVLIVWPRIVVDILGTLGICMFCFGWQGFGSWVAWINFPGFLLPYPRGRGGDFGGTVGCWKPLGYQRPTLEHAPPKPTWAFLIFQTSLLHSWLQ